ncbi:aliphatic nitrilase-like protein [Meredithblackwellia eburnea MCA 4105]
MKSTIVSLSLISLLVSGSPTPSIQKRALPAAGSNLSNLTLAAVRTPPVNWPSPVLNKNWNGVKFDINATVAFGVALISQAKSMGADLVAFPETWFPGYPKGYDLNNWMYLHAPDFIANSLVVNSSQWNLLTEAAATNQIYVALGFSERSGDFIYMAQALIGPDGEVLIHRHKLRPSGSERLLWSDGTIEMLDVVSTPIGRIGMLECWEHFHPAMTFAVQAQTEDIHIGAWPYNPDPTDSAALFWEKAETNDAAARVYAINSGAITVAPAINHGSILSGIGAALVTADSNLSYVQHPIIYTSVNGSTFNNVTYNTNGEQSWAILQQMNAAFPSYIPKDNGTFVAQRSNSVASLISAANNFTATT